MRFCGMAATFGSTIKDFFPLFLALHAPSARRGCGAKSLWEVVLCDVVRIGPPTMLCGWLLPLRSYLLYGFLKESVQKSNAVRKPMTAPNGTASAPTERCMRTVNVTAPDKLAPSVNGQWLSVRPLRPQIAHTGTTTTMAFR